MYFFIICKTKKSNNKGASPSPFFVEIKKKHIRRFLVKIERDNFRKNTHTREEEANIYCYLWTDITNAKKKPFYLLCILIGHVFRIKKRQADKRTRDARPPKKKNADKQLQNNEQL